MKKIKVNSFDQVFNSKNIKESEKVSRLTEVSYEKINRTQEKNEQDSLNNA